MGDENPPDLPPQPHSDYFLRLKLLVVELGTKVLRAFLDSRINDLISALKNKRKVLLKHLNEEQKWIVFPPGNAEQPTSSDFDISILIVILRNVKECNLNGNAPCWIWKKVTRTATSIESHIVRIRNLRNEISHSTKAEFTPDEFEERWSNMELALLGLGQNLIPNIQDEIMEIKNKNLDRISVELKSLKCHSMNFFNEKYDASCYFKTKSFHEAKEKLQKERILVLSGPAGEGKTTTAVHLALDLADKDRCLYIPRSDDWRHIEFPLGRFDVIVIDDIFGAGAINQKELDTWEALLPEVLRVTAEEKVYVVITTRQYILEEAKEKIKSMNKKEVIFELSSNKLSVQDKAEILKLNLQKHKRRTDDNFVQQCVEASNSLFFTGDKGFQFGFPQCVDMFARNESLFNRGITFFEKPDEFFKTCIADLFQRRGEEEEKFLALILVWANDGALSKDEIDPPVESSDLKQIASSFGYELKSGLLRTLRKSLRNHYGGLLTYYEGEAKYTFSHNVISDMIGIVIGEEYPKQVIENCSRDFLLQYVTTDIEKSGYNVHIESRHYSVLAKKMTNMLLRKNNSVKFDTVSEFDALKRKGKRFNSVTPKHDLDFGMIKHDAFQNSEFLDSFMKYIKNESISSQVFTKSVMDLSGYFLSYGIKVDRFEMCLPAYSVFRGQQLFLHKTIEHGFSKIEGSDMNFVLLLAIHSEQFDLVQFLVENGVSITGDAIYVASHLKENQYLKKLLEHNKDNINDKGNLVNGNYPIIVAARKGFKNVVECLIDYKADISVRNNDGMTALHKAVLHDHKDIIELLIKAGASLDVKNKKFKRTPLHIACDQGKLEIVQLLVEKGATVKVKDHRGHYPIHCAAIRGHIRIVKILLEHDKSQGNVKVMSYGKKSFIKGMSMYHIAVWKKNAELLYILNENKINPNIQDCYGQTPLYYAIASQNEEMAEKLLLNPDVDANISQNKGFTPLHAAIFFEKTKLAQLLCLRSDVNKNDKYGRTPLHVACEKANLEMVKTLLDDCNAASTAVTKRGDNVLHILVRNYRKSSKLPEAINIMKTILDKRRENRELLNTENKKRKRVCDLISRCKKFRGLKTYCSGVLASESGICSTSENESIDEDLSSNNTSEDNFLENDDFEINDDSEEYDIENDDDDGDDDVYLFGDDDEDSFDDDDDDDYY